MRAFTSISKGAKKRAALALSRTRFSVVLVVLAAFTAAGASDTVATDLLPALQNVPGMNFTSLSVAAQRELASVLSDEFCYCGCPHALGACLRSHTQCKHAKRMTKLAALQAAAGTSGTEIINSLSAYYLSFREPRVAFKVDDRMCQGAKDAKATLVEFSDFECPYCAIARPVLESFVKNSNGRVRLCMFPFPLPQHPNAIPAGQAVVYAREKGKFWAMHDLLFENQKGLSREVIPKLAAKAGLSAAEVARLIATDKYVKEVEGFRELGRAAHVDSTPSLFINGHRFTLPLTAEALTQAVDDELEWTGNKGSWAADDAR